MQDQLKTHLIQTNSNWQNISENLKNIQEKINAISEKTDLIVLPEMFSTGFVMNPEKIAESMQGESVSWMKKTAVDRQCAITGSLVIHEKGNYYNRAIFINDIGEINFYDKRHLFSHAGEHKNYTAGSEKKIVTYKGWKIALFICYDLRFPVWSRNTENYDIAIYVANWPKPRITAWDTLLKARAIENICYTIGVNRVGVDGNNLEYIGHSQIVNPQGNTIKKSEIATEDIITSTLYKAEMFTNRANFKFLDDKDNFTLL